jgi:hypothetical protein
MPWVAEVVAMWRFTSATYGSKIGATQGVYPMPAVRMTASSADRKPAVCASERTDRWSSTVTTSAFRFRAVLIGDSSGGWELVEFQRGADANH